MDERSKIQDQLLIEHGESLIFAMIQSCRFPYLEIFTIDELCRFCSVRDGCHRLLKSWTVGIYCLYLIMVPVIVPLDWPMLTELRVAGDYNNEALLPEAWRHVV